MLKSLVAVLFEFKAKMTLSLEPMARERLSRGPSKRQAASMNVNKYGSDQVGLPSTNVFVNYIPQDFTESDLHELFSKYGKVVCTKVMINLETGQSKCFGFVRYADLNSARAAIAALNGIHIKNKRLLVKYAESKEKTEYQSSMIYVKQVPIFCDLNFVAKLFTPFGEVVTVTPHIVDTIDPNSYRCFVQFDSIESASKAVAAMNNKVVVSGMRPIYIRYADPRFTRPPSSPQLSPPMYEINEQNLLPSFLCS